MSQDCSRDTGELRHSTVGNNLLCLLQPAHLENKNITGIRRSKETVPSDENKTQWDGS